MSEAEKQSSNLGRKLVLWRTEYRENAYRDQLGVSHCGNVILEEVAITIKEARLVLGHYTEAKMEGWKALVEDGRVFLCNWKSYDETSSRPTYHWWLEGARDARGGLFVDACQAYRHKFPPHITSHGEKAVPLGASKCEKHDEVFMPGDTCWKCDNQLPAVACQES